MHIAIDKEFRGQRIGQKLVTAFLHYAKEKGITELTAPVHDGNAAACRFFEHLGFEARGHYPMVMARQQGLEHYHSVFYVKKII